MRRVGAGQHLAAGGGELPEPRGDQLAVGDDLHVPELAHVVVVAAPGGPTDEDVRGALHQPLALDDPAAMVVVAARPAVRLVHRRSRLLDLQEQRVIAVAALQQDQVYPHPDAAHPDHLADGVDEREPVQQVAALVGQGVVVGGEQLLGEAVVAVLPDRRVLGDPQVPVAVLGELPERAAVGALARLALDVGGAADLVGFGEDAEELVDGDQVVPDVEPAGGGVAGHPLPVGAQAGRDRRLRAVGAHAVGAGQAPRCWPPAERRPIRTGRAASHRSPAGRTTGSVPGWPTARS